MNNLLFTPTDVRDTEGVKYVYEVQQDIDIGDGPFTHTFGYIVVDEDIHYFRIDEGADFEMGDLQEIADFMKGLKNV